jgi:hypothetical protein
VTDPPSAPDSTLFTHVDTMISAYSAATDEEERLLYLRGIARGLEQIAGQLHARLGALVDVASGSKSAPSWTYAEYWNTVIGTDRTAAQVIRESKLSPGDEAAIGEWLCIAEDAALDKRELETELPAEWEAHHERALRALVNARVPARR